MSDQVAIDHSFVPDWLREECGFFFLDKSQTRSNTNLFVFEDDFYRAVFAVDPSV